MDIDVETMMVRFHNMFIDKRFYGRFMHTGTNNLMARCAEELSKELCLDAKKRVRALRLHSYVFHCSVETIRRIAKRHVNSTTEYRVL